MNNSLIGPISASHLDAIRTAAATGSGKRIFSILMLLALALSLCASARADEGDSPSFAYLLHCAGCHLEDGSGDPPEIPDLRQEFGLLLTSQRGRDYSLRVPGVTDTPVAAEEMAALMTWMVARLFPDRAEFEPFTAAEVIAGRNNRLQDPARYRKELLLELDNASTGGSKKP